MKPHRKKDIYLLVFDSLRPDFLSCYNSESIVETPNFDQVAEQGTLLQNTFSVGPNTEISHAGLFTSQYPSQTGVVGGNISLPRDKLTMAEYLQSEGYRTIGISGPAKIRSDLNYDKGFGKYVEPYYCDIEPTISFNYVKEAMLNPLVRNDFVRTLKRGPDSLTELKFEYIKEEVKRSTQSPTFVFTNFTTCHSPYNPPRPYKTEITDGLDRTRWFLSELLLNIINIDSETLSAPNIRPDRVFRAAGGAGGPYFQDTSWLNDDEMNILRKWYAASLKYLDMKLGEFIEWLENTGRYDNSLIILTSDHGENFGEHELLYHGRTLYDTVLQVPLIISGLSSASVKESSKMTSLIDIFPTVCELCNLPIPDDINGKSILSDQERRFIFAEIGKRDWKESKFSEFYSEEQKKRFSLGLKCIRSANEKFILRSDGFKELYSIPNEERTECSLDIDNHLYDELVDVLTNDFFHTSGGKPFDNQVQRNLKELGYI